MAADRGRVQRRHRRILEGGETTNPSLIPVQLKLVAAKECGGLRPLRTHLRALGEGDATAVGVERGAKRIDHDARAPRRELARAQPNQKVGQLDAVDLGATGVNHPAVARRRDRALSVEHEVGRPAQRVGGQVEIRRRHRQIDRVAFDMKGEGLGSGTSRPRLDPTGPTRRAELGSDRDRVDLDPRLSKIDARRMKQRDRRQAPRHRAQ